MQNENQFEKYVFPAELQEIKKRRKNVRCSTDPSRSGHSNRNKVDPMDDRPEQNLVGLALSGGGIRSATFGLGVIQALAKHDTFKHVDYLSTVSGGGYIGAAISALLNSKTSGPSPTQDPFCETREGTESPAWRRLRNNQNYLVSGGWLGKLEGPVVLLRGIVVNFCMLFLFYLVLVSWVSYLLWNAPIREALVDELKVMSFFRFAPWLAIIPLVLALLHPLLFKVKAFQVNQDVRGFYNRVLTYAFVGTLIVALIEAVPLAIAFYTRHRIAIADGSSSSLWTVIVGLAPVVGAVLASTAIQNLATRFGRYLLYIVAAAAPAFLFVIFLYLSSLFYHYEYLRGSDIWTLCGVAAPMTLWILLIGSTALWGLYWVFEASINSTSMHHFYRDRLSNVFLMKLGGAKVETQTGLKLSELNAADSAAPYHLINCTLNLHGSSNQELRGRNADFFLMSRHFIGSKLVGYATTRDVEELDPHVDLGTAMAISGAAASPNMGDMKVGPLAFIMGLLNIRLGYWAPNPRVVRHLTHDATCAPLEKEQIGTPERSTNTFTLQRRFCGIPKPVGRVGPVYLLKELFGLVNEKAPYLNLSDGGHLENLGVYELLRRRCRYIIVCDAEADPNMLFSSLAKVVRFARIDLGIKITLDLDNLRKDKTGFSQRHCAIGSIEYPPSSDTAQATEGRILYIKASLTGDEGEFIRAYRARHPSFPHETTADQLFDEAQYEAYRALGFDMVDELFADCTDGDPIETWINSLKPELTSKFLIDETFVELQNELAVIEQAFMDSDVAEYTYQIYPEFLKSSHHPEFPPPKATPEGERRILHICNLQMELMENVFAALRLDRVKRRDSQFNRGWLELFRSWAQAEYFRTNYRLTIKNYSGSFEWFCREKLGLKDSPHDPNQLSELCDSAGGVGTP